MTTESKEMLIAAKEIWKPIPGYEGLYEASSLGNIRNSKTGAVLSKCLTGAGYIKTDLWKDGTKLQSTAHRIVAMTFHGCPEGKEVNHKNGIKTDNRADNLEWVTRSENEVHSRYVLKNLVRAVTGIEMETGNTVEFPSVMATGPWGFEPKRVSAICHKRKGVHLGWCFRFTDEFTHPPKQVGGLSDEVITQLSNEHLYSASNPFAKIGGVIGFARAIERELWIRQPQSNQPAECVKSDFQKIWPFYEKHALGPKRAPSCLLCGGDTQYLEVAITHGELPGIVICKPCHDFKQQLTAANEEIARLRKDAERYQYMRSINNPLEIIDYVSGRREYMWGDKLDKVIDTALSSQSQSAEGK